MAAAAEKISLLELAKRFEQLERALEDPQDMLEEVGLAMVYSTQKRFDEGISPDGVPWEPPSELTKSTRLGKKGGENALQDRGELAASISHFVEGDNVHWGSGLVYARIHQEGGTIRAKDAPALTIPLHPAARRVGYRRLKEHGLFRLPGQPVLALPGKDGAVTPMFALKQSVKIPQRRYLGVSRGDEGTIKEIVFEFISGELS